MLYYLILECRDELRAMCSVIGDLVCVIMSHIVYAVLSDTRVSRWITCDVLRDWWLSVCHTVIYSMLYYLIVECWDELRAMSDVVGDLVRVVLSHIMCVVLSDSRVSRWITCDELRAMCYVIGDLVCVIMSPIVYAVLSDTRVSRWITCNFLRD